MELYDKFEKNEEVKWWETKKPVPLNFNLIELAEHIIYTKKKKTQSNARHINCNKNISPGCYLKRRVKNFCGYL